MKSKKPLKWIISLIVVLIITIPLAIKVHMKNEHDEMIKIATSEKANVVYKKGLKILDKKAFTKDGIIKSYKLDKKSVEHNPMGGYDVTVIINNNKELYVDFGLDSSDDGRTLNDSGLVSYSVKLDKLLEENKK